MSTKLIEQKEEAALKYHKYTVEGRFILASYWHRKWRKIDCAEKKAAALYKRQLASDGIKRLNTIKI
jgi:hypothetical protein